MRKRYVKRVVYHGKNKGFKIQIRDTLWSQFKPDTFPNTDAGVIAADQRISEYEQEDKSNE